MPKTKTMIIIIFASLLVSMAGNYIYTNSAINAKLNNPKTYEGIDRKYISTAVFTIRDGYPFKFMEKGDSGTHISWGYFLLNSIIFALPLVAVILLIKFLLR